MREGFVLPTRLAVAAADFIISHTVALTRKDLDSGVSANKEKLFTSNLQNQSISTLAAASNEKVKTASKGLELSKNLEMKSLLWAHMDDLITLVDRLRAVCLQIIQQFFLDAYTMLQFLTRCLFVVKE